ncbi:MAG: Flp pilus assembly protein CpaB [Bacillota bacterium]
MDKGRIFRLVLIPIVAGLIVTLIAQRVMTAPKQAAAPQAEMVAVVVVAAQAPISARTKITESQVAIKRVPKELATGSEFETTKDVVGKIAMVQLQPGEVVLKQRVVEEGQGALPYRIPEGKRAITIRMDELNGVAGHPEVGDLVDLILFLPEKEINSVKRPASARMMYEGVPILAKGLATPVGSAPKPGEQKLTSLTLALSPEAATEVTLAEQIGYVKMVLRPALKTPDSGNIKVEETKYSPATAAPAPAQPGR